MILRPGLAVRLGSMLLLISWVLGLCVGCSPQGAQKHFLLAEKFWAEGKYLSAVEEYDRASSRDPKGDIGLEAVYRAGSTLTLFLGRHAEALLRFRTFMERSPDAVRKREAEKQIGEILYSKLEQLEPALEHYQRMLEEQPNAPDTPEIVFRMGRASYLLADFGAALKSYRDVYKRFPASPWAERAAYEIAVTLQTRASQRGRSVGRSGATSSEEGYQEAIDAFEKFVQVYPKSRWELEARFGIASCLEELNQLEAAQQAFQSIESRYPSPQAIRIKLKRLSERIRQKRRTANG